MRARSAATYVAALALLIGSLALAGPATAKPKRPKPTVAISVSAAEFDAGAQPTVTYSWTGLRKRDRLKLQYRTKSTGAWRTEQRLPKVTSRNGTASVTVRPVELGEVSYRFFVVYRKNPKVYSSRRTIAAETGPAKVFGAVPIEDVIRTYPASNADLSKGSVSIGGQPFAFTFHKFFTGENVWRTLVSVPATSCKGWGIPLATRYRSGGSGGTFGMQALGAGGALLYSNAAAPGTGTGMLFPTAVGSTVTIQLRSDADVDYFGSGQAICYTDDGRV